MVRILELEKYAKENNIPIMEHDGIEFLLKLIKENKYKNILEIGAAIGYSSIRMALLDNDINITTVERDEVRYNEAVKNINSFNLNDRIKIYNMDAFELELTDKYDLIFIDAAKSQYIKFFEKFKNNLSDNGVVVSDNLNFHGLTHTKEHIQSRNVRGIVRKLNNYIEFLENNKEFETKFYDIGDGISISKKSN